MEPRLKYRFDLLDIMVYLLLLILSMKFSDKWLEAE